jgi:protocatechuate 3,4-dioxygenase beta subunit
VPSWFKVCGFKDEGCCEWWTGSVVRDTIQLMRSPDSDSPASLLERRRFLGRLGLAAGFFTVPGLFAETLTRTPAQTEGPFYPDRLPLDTDNDLIVVNDSLTPSGGIVTWLSGRILDSRGAPIRNAVVEIWQADANGVYLHKGSDNGGKRDAHFQGFGRFLTGTTGEYLFRTIKPVPYPGRTPHIHFAVKIPGQEKFTTQCYVQGDAGNGKDGVLRGITDAKARQSVIIPFAPLAQSKAGELAATFDVVLGFTPSA